MLCVIPFFANDRDHAARLAHWIKDLGGVGGHDCLLVVDKGTTERGIIEPLREAFRSVQLIWAQSAGAQGTWGTGTTDATAANEMFLTAAHFIYHKIKQPWFWLEPDAAPTRSTWLNEIEVQYREGKKPFMGAYVDMPPHEPHMSGIAVYPAYVAKFSMDMMVPSKIAWDYAGRRDTVNKGKAHFTKLIQHEYRVGDPPVAPTFPTLQSLIAIKPDTAVYHRCKDSTLIDRLRERWVQQQGVPAPATLTREQELEKQIAELRAKLQQPQASPSTKKRGHRMTPKKPEKRTPEQQAAIDARMAKARAARKANG